jgi:hypothetical protein
MIKTLLGLPALALLAGGIFVATVESAAAAVVYCKTAGVPRDASPGPERRLCAVRWSRQGLERLASVSAPARL